MKFFIGLILSILGISFGFDLFIVFISLLIYGLITFLYPFIMPFWRNLLTGKYKSLAYALIYNSDFGIKLYSQTDRKLMINLGELNLKSANITNREILIFKWYLIRSIFINLKNDGVKEKETIDIIADIDLMIQKDFNIELKTITDSEINKRFLYYSSSLHKINEVTGGEILNIFISGNNEGNISYDITGILLVLGYINGELENKSKILNILQNNPEKINQLNLFS